MANENQIPVFVIQEHLHGDQDALQRCPCGSSLFRIKSNNEELITSPRYGKDKKVKALNIQTNVTDWEEICAVCGNRYGGTSFPEKQIEVPLSKIFDLNKKGAKK